MKKVITLSVTHPTLPDDLIQGFRFFWAYYVSGFRSELHCQPCFKGRRIKEFSTGHAQSGRLYSFGAMDRFPYVYVCGVGSGPKKALAAQNFHFPLKYAEGEVVTATTYNGYVVTARNAVAVPIPALPEGWNGRDRETTRCKNFQFAVAYFGYETGGPSPQRKQDHGQKDLRGEGRDTISPETIQLQKGDEQNRENVRQIYTF